MRSTAAAEGIKISDIALINLHARTLGDPKFQVKIMFKGKATVNMETDKKGLDGDRVLWNGPFFIAGDITDSVLAFKVIKAHWFTREMFGLCQEKVVDLIQQQDKSGSCRLEINGKNCQLTFTIGLQYTILPSIIAEVSEASTRISGVLRWPLQIANEARSVQDTIADGDTWTSFLSQYQIFMNAMDKIAEVHPYAKLAWGILSAIPKSILTSENRNDSVRQLCEKMKDVYDYITDVKRLPKLNETQENVLSTLVQQTIECACLIREYSKRSIAENIWKGAVIDEKINSFINKFDHIKNVMTDSVTLETSIVTLRVSKTVSEIKNSHLLDDMPYARGAGFLSTKKCLLGTRQKLIEELLEWVGSDSPERILVLSGQAGTGKSAVAHTVAQIFQKQNRLGSLFCFNRSYKDRIHFLFSTISRDLADGDGLWRQSLTESIDRTAIRRSTDMETQFNEFIIKPSKEVRTLGPVVIVIDALDESGDRGDRRTLLNILFSQSSMLPTNYRIIITTRPEQDIESCCKPPTALCKRMGEIAADETLADIRSYVSFRLEPISETLDELQRDWPDSLSKRSEGLFQWAETVCRFIDPTIPHPLLVRKRWKACTPSSSSSLYELYHDIISCQQETEDPEFVSHLKMILSVLMTVREPLSISALEDIFQGIIEDVNITLTPFGSLLLGVHDSFAPIRPLHTSLFDFFNSRYQDATKKNEYYIDTSDQGVLTLGCLKLMNRMLRFNICNLETSHLRNEDVPDFDTRLKTAIPIHLSYSCRFWAHHLRESHFTRDLVTQVRTLMHDHLLYLFEVLGLLGEVEQGLVAMRIIRFWCEGVDHELIEQALDAWQFAFNFGVIITESTPHLYLSALPFTSSDSFIFKQYLPMYPQLFDIKVGRSLDSLVKVGFMKKNSPFGVTSLAFSPKGRYVTATFENGEFWFWDYEFGEIAHKWGRRKDNGAEILDIVSSQDGQLVYCCFNDGVIRILDVKAKETVDESYQEAFEGQCYWCTISSDGHNIAFSDIDVLWLYNTKTRQKPIRLDGYSVPHPVFSPNGDLLAFTRGDGVVCLWNTRRQGLVYSWTEFQHHTFTLSDKYIAFGCDSCIEVWDICTFTKVHEFKTQVYSVCLAGDRYLLSSFNRTYTIWSILTGELIVETSLECAIWSIAASPDLMFIGLGKWDGTVHIQPWDVVIQSKTSDDNPERIDALRLWLRSRYLIQLYKHRDKDDQFIRISDITTANGITFEVQIMPSLKFHVVATSPTDHERVYVAYVTTQGLCCWNDEDGESVLDETARDFTSIEFSTTGNHLLSSDSSGIIKIWEIGTRSLIGGPHTIAEGANVLALSETGDSFLTAYNTAEKMSLVEARDCRSGCILKGPFKFDRLHSDAFSHRRSPLYRVAFSPNMTRIVCITQSGVGILDVVTGKDEIFHPYSDYGPLHQLSPDRKHIAWFFGNNQVELWETDHGVSVQELRPNGYLRNTFFSDDSTQLAVLYSMHDGYYIDIWHIPTGKRSSRAIQIFGTLVNPPVLPLIGNHLVFAPDNVATSLNLDVHEIMSSLYEHHRSRTKFGMFPLIDSKTREKIQRLDKSISDNEETLNYALVAWEKALYSTGTEINREGWMLGPHEELIIWIPENRREAFWAPCMTHIAAKAFTKLNFDNFVHGIRWTECKENSSDVTFGTKWTACYAYSKSDHDAFNEIDLPYKP